MRAIEEQTGITAGVVARYRTVKHAFTHFSVTMHAFSCRHLKGRTRAIGCADAAWVKLDELDEYAFSRANRRFIDFLASDSPELVD